MTEQPRTNVTYIEDENGRRIVPDIVPPGYQVPPIEIESTNLPAEPPALQEEED